MTGFAESFLTHVRRWHVHPDIVEGLMGSDHDLEDLIERVDAICEAADPLELLEVDVSAVGPRVASIRREVEWYVQHVAERIVPRDAHLMWGPALGCASSHEIVLVTTNYDRAIEVAANVEGIELDDGFGEVEDGETARWVGFEHTDGRVVLVKLHGSTDWYRDRQSRRAIKLRHPMPLFADGTLVFGPRELGAALVLPSREKILTGEPYPRLSEKFLDAGDKSELIVTVGSSLRDPHIRQAVETWAGKKPVFMVNPAGESPVVRGAKVIRETASEFLISTLPNALTSEDVVPSLKRRCHGGDEVDGLKADESEGIIALVQMGLDRGVEGERRCDAVGRLVDRGATLPVAWVERLIGEDDPALARHALGLILGSSGYEKLMEIAKESPHMADRTFHDEYRMLGEEV